MPPKRKTHCLRGHLRDRVDPGRMCYYCKELYQKRYRQTEGGLLTYKNSMLKKYGMTVAGYQMLAKTQNYKCLICDRIKPLVVDHKHSTGKIRDLLCKHCNSVVLNIVENNPELIYRAQKYLEETNAENNAKA